MRQIDRLVIDTMESVYAIEAEYKKGNISYEESEQRCYDIIYEAAYASGLDNPAELLDQLPYAIEISEDDILEIDQ